LINKVLPNKHERCIGGWDGGYLVLGEVAG
jgi:hypothetical protein